MLQIIKDIMSHKEQAVKAEKSVNQFKSDLAELSKATR